MTSQKVWFISDLHFNHTSVLYFYPKRREAAGITLEELQNDKNSAIAKHNEWLINYWNSIVKKNDIIYMLGDFSLSSQSQAEAILSRLNGRKYFILGNHDKNLVPVFKKYCEWVGDIKEAKFTNNQYAFINPNETFSLVMEHCPLLTWDRRSHGSCHLHGHCHGSIDGLNKTLGELRVDAGLDGELANYEFISLEKLYNYYMNIVKSNGFETFSDYVKSLIEKQGIVM